MKHVSGFLKSGLMIMIIFLVIYGQTYAQTATATVSGTWDPQTQTGTAIWSGGTGAAGSPAPGNSITISSGVEVTLTNNGAGNYNYFTNQNGSPSGLDLNGYSISFTGNASGGCAGTGGGKFVLTGSNQSLSGTYTADSIIFRGSGSKVISATSTLYGHTVINSGCSVIADAQALNLYGNIINYGSTSNNSGALTINMYGNLTNHGTWDAFYTFMKMPVVISGNGPFNNTMTIDTTCQIAGKVTFELLIVPADDSLLIPAVTDTLVTTGVSTVSGTVFGNGAVHYNGNITSSNTTVQYIYVGAGSHSYAGMFTADSVVFGGSGTKTLWANSVINGNVVVKSGVSISGDGKVLDVYGNFMNYGTVTYAPSATTINMYGNLTNNGTWNGYYTNMKIPAVLSGTGALTNIVTIDTSCQIAGKVTVEQLIVPADDSLLIPAPTDTLVTTGVSTVSGTVYGNGAVNYNHNITSANTALKYIYFGGGTHSFSGSFTGDTIVFGGTGSKSFPSNTSLTGAVKVNSGVSVNGNNTTLIVYGPVMNSGTVSNVGNETLNAYGDLTNNGTWSITNTNIRAPLVIGGTSLYNTIMTADTTCRIAGKVQIKQFNLLAGDSLLIPESTDTLVTTGTAISAISGSVYGSGAVYYNGGVSSANTNVPVIFFGGANQSLNGTFAAPLITFGGSGTKTFTQNMVLYGNAVINSGVTVQGSAGMTLTVYGALINNGIVSNVSNETFNAYGDLTNNGTWGIYNTNIRAPLVIAGASLYSTQMAVDTTCSIAGRVRIRDLSISSGDTVIIPNMTDTLTVTETCEAAGTGSTRGNGTVVIGGTNNQSFSGQLEAGTFIMGGTSTKTFSANTTLRGNLLINSGVTMRGTLTTLTVNGSVMNYGTVSHYSNETIYITHDLLNYGSWQILYTYLNDTGLTAGNFTNASSYLYINANRRLSGSLSLSNRVTLNGIVTTNENDTFIVNTSNFTRSSGYIDGNLRMPVATGSPVTEFHLGNAHGYTPVTVSFSGVTTAGMMTVGLITGAHPLMAYPDSALTRYWKFAKDNLTFVSYSPTLRYLAEDFNAGIHEPDDESTMVAGARGDTSWSFPAITSRTPGGSNDGGSLVLDSLFACQDLVIANDTFAFRLNLPPEIVSSIPDTAFDEDFGVGLIADLNQVFTEPEGKPMSFTLNIPDEGLQAYLTDDSLYLESVLNHNGVFSIEVNASDGFYTTSDTFLVTVNPVNDAPTPCHLLSPINGDTLADLMNPVEFLWTQSADADADTLKYSLHIYNLNRDTLIADLPDTTFSITAVSWLETDSAFSWEVSVSDGHSATGSDSVFVFFVPVGNLISSSPTLTFEDIIIGESDTLETALTVHNAPVHVDSICFTGGIHFSMISPGTFPAIIGMADTLKLIIIFSPMVTGNFADSVIVYNNSPVNPVFIPLAGTCINMPAGTIIANPGNIDFGNVTAGSDTLHDLIALTVQTAPVVVDSVVLKNRIYYSVIPSQTPGFEIGLNDTMFIDVGFFPLITGTLEDTVLIFNNSSVNPVLIPLRGTSVEEPEGILVVSPESMDFGDVTAGSDTLHDLIALTVQTAPVIIDSVALKNRIHYSVIPSQGPGYEIGLNDSMFIDVRFFPQITGTLEDTIVIYNNSPVNPVLIPLRGTGVEEPAGVLAASPGNLTFGDVPAGDSLRLSIRVTAQTAPVLADSFCFIHGAQYKATPLQNLPFRIGLSDTLVLDAMFIPSGFGNYPDTVFLFSNAQNSPLMIPVSGNGIAGMLTVSADSLDYGTRRIGDSASASVVIKAQNGMVQVTDVAQSINGPVHFVMGEMPSMPVLLRSGADSLVLTVLFRPAFQGLLYDTIRIVSNSEGGECRVFMKGSVAPNHAPNAFSVKQFNALNLISSVRPDFRWEGRGDEDGDALMFGLHIARNGSFVDTVQYVMTADTGFTVVQPLDSSSVYHWRVRAYDAYGGERLSNAGQVTIDAIKAQMVTGALWSSVLRGELNFYSVTNETMDTVRSAFVLTDTSAGQTYTSHSLMQMLRDGVYFSSYRVTHTGRLTVTTIGKDRAGNLTQAVRQYGIGRLNKNGTMWNDEGWSVESGKGAVTEDGFLLAQIIYDDEPRLINPVSAAMEKTKVKDGLISVSPVLDLRGSVPLKSGRALTVWMNYDPSGLAIDGIDERKIAMYTLQEGAWVPAGGQGESGKVKACIGVYGKLRLFYDPERNVIPKAVSLGQNYPNPFNPGTNIRYQLPARTHVNLTIYNILGQEVRQLINATQNPGYYNVYWDGKNNAGNMMTSGLYIYHISAGQFKKTMKMVLVK